jgi:hypothetical protein
MYDEYIKTATRKRKEQTHHCIYQIIKFVKMVPILWPFCFLQTTQFQSTMDSIQAHFEASKVQHKAEAAALSFLWTSSIVGSQHAPRLAKRGKWAKKAPYGQFSITRKRRSIRSTTAFFWFQELEAELGILKETTPNKE